MFFFLKNWRTIYQFETREPKSNLA